MEYIILALLILQLIIDYIIYKQTKPKPQYDKDEEVLEGKDALLHYLKNKGKY